MSDWVTISSLATAGGTLVLAVATYQSVRSANRTARVAERSLLEGVRPVLIPSRDGDPVEQVRFGDGMSLTVAGHGAAVRIADGVPYLAVALRNGGSGLGVIHGWRARPAADTSVDIARGEMMGDAPAREAQQASVNRPPELSEFRRQQLDLYIAAGEAGYWQGAIRDPDEPGFTDVTEAIIANAAIWIDLIYGDSEGGQRTIVRLRVSEREDESCRGQRAALLEPRPRGSALAAGDHGAAT